MTDALIHLRVPAELKARWVRLSRENGKKLTDWILNEMSERKDGQPAHDDVRKLREAMQQRESLGITAAQDRCAAALHTSRRAWQQWEAGDRGMHPAFWELARIKLS